MTNTLSQTKDPGQFRIPALDSGEAQAVAPEVTVSQIPELLDRQDPAMAERQHAQYIDRLSASDVRPQPESAELVAARADTERAFAQPETQTVRQQVAAERSAQSAAEIDPVAASGLARQLGKGLGAYRGIVTNRENRADYALAA